MKSRLWIFGTLWIVFCARAFAAGGEGDMGEMMVVADTRQLSGLHYFIANLYNENFFSFGLFSIATITVLGAGLGFFMDFLLKFSGLDLGKTRKVEH